LVDNSAGNFSQHLRKMKKPSRLRRRLALKASLLGLLSPLFPSRTFAQPSAPIVAGISPITRRIALPPNPDATAIWGAIGRDAAGSIWFGVSVHRGYSATLMQLDPVSLNVRPRGEVMVEYAKIEPPKHKHSQLKIHSQIVQGPDGFIYFTSHDEVGASGEKRTPPTFGGNLWRLNPKVGNWERLHATRDGLIAACGGGRYIFAMGFYGHNVYRYDTKTGAIRTKFIDSHGRHVSRNFFADARGHVYVPRVQVGRDGKYTASLLEFNTEFVEIANTALPYYNGNGDMGENHGIIATVSGAPGRHYFATHIGRLYEAVYSTDAGAATINDLGWFHPAGTSYTASLFSFEGGNRLATAALLGNKLEWVEFDVKSKQATVAPFDTKGSQVAPVFGSGAMDSLGRVYLGGTEARAGGGSQPFLLQVSR
jgi:hypothetical protein